MQVPVAQRALVVQTLGRALAQRAPYAKVIADETTADAILAMRSAAVARRARARQYVAAIAHHTYDFPNDALRRLLPPMSNRFSKPTWMTEICCYKGSGGIASSFGAQYDPTMTQGFWLADQIYDDLTIAGDSAWYWWTALSPVIGCDPKADPTCVTRVNAKGFNDGLLYYDQNYATMASPRSSRRNGSSCSGSSAATCDRVQCVTTWPARRRACESWPSRAGRPGRDRRGPSSRGTRATRKRRLAWRCRVRHQRSSSPSTPRRLINCLPRRHPRAPTPATGSFTFHRGRSPRTSSADRTRARRSS